MNYNVSLIVPYKHDDWGYREKNWFWCWRYWSRFGPNYLDISVGGQNLEPFNRSKARNDAFDKSIGDILIIADADTVISGAALALAVESVAKEETPWSVPYDWYYNLSQEYTDFLQNSGYGAPDPDHKLFAYEHKILSWAGVLVIPREAYTKIGGYDERFKGWGFEDVAFRVKLDAEWGKHSRQEGDAYHLWHPIAEADRFTQENTRDNKLLFQKQYADKYGWTDERIPTVRRYVTLGEQSD